MRDRGVNFTHKFHLQHGKLIFALGAKVFVFETKFKLKIRILNLSPSAKHYFFKKLDLNLVKLKMFVRKSV